MDISMEQDHPNELDIKIHELCSFTYYEYLQPPPKILQAQDKISLAAIYTVINHDDLCTCGILAHEVYMYEFMHTCSQPDTKLTLYYVYNRALTNYDPIFLVMTPASILKNHINVVHQILPTLNNNISTLVMDLLHIE